MTRPEISEALSKLSPYQCQRLLIRLAFELTILARGDLIERDLSTARRVNDAIHRLLGLLQSGMQHFEPDSTALIVATVDGLRIGSLLDNLLLELRA